MSVELRLVIEQSIDGGAWERLSGMDDLEGWQLNQIALTLYGIDLVEFVKLDRRGRDKVWDAMKSDGTDALRKYSEIVTADRTVN